MEMSYQEAMDKLKSMFENFDEDTIKTVLSSNDGHVEKTIDDLIKLTDEVEKIPDDENLFAEPSRNKSRPGGGLFTDFDARTKQEDEDAKMAYELQKQYMEEEQRAGGGSRNSNNYNAPVSESRDNEEPHIPFNRFDYSKGSKGRSNRGGQGGQNVGYAQPNRYDYGESGSNMTGQNVGYGQPSNIEKKPNFMKKVKIGLQNLFKGKGKIFRKGSKDQGYQEFEKYEPMQERLNPGPVNNYEVNSGAQYEEEESPMKLQEVMADQGINKEEIRRQEMNERNESPVYKQADMRKENVRKYNDYGGSRQDELISPNHFDYTD